MALGWIDELQSAKRKLDAAMQMGNRTDNQNGYARL